MMIVIVNFKILRFILMEFLSLCNLAKATFQGYFLNKEIVCLKFWDVIFTNPLFEKFYVWMKLILMKKVTKAGSLQLFGSFVCVLAMEIYLIYIRI